MQDEDTIYIFNLHGGIKKSIFNNRSASKLSDGQIKGEKVLPCNLTIHFPVCGIKYVFYACTYGQIKMKDMQI